MPRHRPYRSTHYYVMGIRMDLRGQRNSNRGTHGHEGDTELTFSLGYFDEVDERWQEDRTYDEAVGPPNPHRGPPKVDVWASPLDAIDVKVGAVQQAHYNIRTYSPIGRLIHETPGRSGYRMGCRCDDCILAEYKMKGVRHLHPYTRSLLSEETIAKIEGRETVTATEQGKRSREQVLADANAPLDHDIVCQFCHKFTIPAGTSHAKTRLASHERRCEDNPNRLKGVDEQMESWPERVKRGELIPFAEMTPYDKEREKFAAIVRALAEAGGIVESPTGGATAVLLDLVPFDIKGPNFTTAYLPRLTIGGWVERNVNGKRTYSYALTKAAKVYYPPQTKREEAPEPPPIQEQIDEQYGVTSEPETAPTETAGSPVEEPVPGASVTAPAPVADDDAGEAEELGGRPGRFAARILREIPEIVELAVRQEIQRDRDANYAAMGYFPTIPQDELDDLRNVVERAENREAQLQTRIEDLQRELTMLGFAFDEIAEQQDSALARSNDGTPSMKGSLSAEKVRDPLKGLARVALKAGWTIKTTRGGHLAWRSPEGRTVFSASTGHSNSVNIMRRKLRRAGLEIEGRTQESADVDKFAGWND